MDLKTINEKEEKIANHIMHINNILGIEVTRGNEETPFRIAKMLYREVFKNVNKPISELESQMTLFENPNRGDDPIKIKGIKFHSMCEHHWMPFFGECDIEYIPNKSILGLSKFPRIVDWFSKKPQVQESLTRGVGEFLVQLVEPKFLRVTIRDTTHTCVSARGIEAECSTDTTYTYHKPVMQYFK